MMSRGMIAAITRRPKPKPPAPHHAEVIEQASGLLVPLGDLTARLVGLPARLTALEAKFGHDPVTEATDTSTPGGQ